MTKEEQAEIDHFWYLKDALKLAEVRCPLTTRMLRQEMVVHVRHLIESGIVKPGHRIPKVSWS